MFRVKFWGVRGSIPVPGPDTVKIGGNTSCVEVQCGNNLIILDAGTGIRLLGNKLIKNGKTVAHILISHVHWDHIQGFPFFLPAFIKGNEFFIYGGRNVTTTLEETLYGQMNFPNFPVMLKDLPSKIYFNDLEEGEEINIGDGEIKINNIKLNHPNGVFCYRIEYDNKILIYATDTEHTSNPDDKLISFAKNAALFIYDAQYLPEEYTGEIGGVPKVGWGHSTMTEGAKIAKLAGAKKLILFHHDPTHTDEVVEEKVRRAKEDFPETEAATEGLEIDLDSI